MAHFFVDFFHFMVYIIIEILFFCLLCSQKSEKERRKNGYKRNFYTN